MNLLAPAISLKEYCSYYQFLEYPLILAYLKQNIDTLPTKHLFIIKSNKISLIINNPLLYPPSILFPTMNLITNFYKLKPDEDLNYICRIEDYCSKWSLVKANFINWLKSAGEPFNKMITDDGYFIFPLNTQPIVSFPIAKDKLLKKTVLVDDFIDSCFEKNVIFRKEQYLYGYRILSPVEINYHNLKLGGEFNSNKILGIYSLNNYYINFFIRTL